MDTQTCCNGNERDTHIFARVSSVRGAGRKAMYDTERRNASVFSIPSQKRITNLRETLSIPENDLVVFALGRIVLKKGFDLLIQALPHIQKKFGM